MSYAVPFAGPLEIYEVPWWRDHVPHQRLRGPSYRLTKRQLIRLIRDVEFWLGFTEKYPVEYAIEEADSSDLIERISLGRAITPFDGEMPQPNSDDSYNIFVRRNPHMVGQFSEARSTAQLNRYQRQAYEQQVAWEAERRARQQAREAEANRLWDEDAAERIRREWHQISDRFIDQPFIRVRIGPENIQVRDEDASWTRKFMADKIYYVPDEVAGLLINLHRSSQI